jgi:predicted branched-subunit amino acid permease
MVVAFVGIVVPALRRKADWACAAVALVSAVLTHDWPYQTGLLFSALLAVAIGMALSGENADE